MKTSGSRTVNAEPPDRDMALISWRIDGTTPVPGTHSGGLASAGVDTLACLETANGEQPHSPQDAHTAQ